MDLHQFESASTKEVKSVSTTAGKWAELKQLMSSAQSVEEWNDLREEAKKLYPMTLINRLDISGYIVETLKPVTA